MQAQCVCLMYSVHYCLILTINGIQKSAVLVLMNNALNISQVCTCRLKWQRDWWSWKSKFVLNILLGKPDGYVVIAAPTPLPFLA